VAGEAVEPREGGVDAACAQRLGERSGLKNSHFTNIVTPAGAKRLMRTTWVSPMVERMLSWIIAAA